MPDCWGLAGLLVAARELPKAEQGFVQLVGLFDTHQVVRVGIEGSGNFGRAVAIHLPMCWPSGWSDARRQGAHAETSRQRRSQLGKGKTDPVDA